MVCKCPEEKRRGKTGATPYVTTTEKKRQIEEKDGLKKGYDALRSKKEEIAID